MPTRWSLTTTLAITGTVAATPERGFVKVRSHFTDDLDSLYEQVMNLRTDGGDEYVGWTLDTAVTQLEWSTSGNAAKILFVAGNESADQAREVHDFRTVASEARERGIVINALFAGDREQGIRELWQAVAEAGGGMYTAIDQAAATHQLAAPQDDQLQRLNVALNKTYVGYGARGAEGKANQVRQDTNTVAVGAGTANTRTAFKASGSYSNTYWDVVDGVKAGKLNLKKVRESDLPKAMRKLSAEEREAYVKKLEAERAEIQAQIDEISKKRARYLKKKAKVAGDGGLDEAMSEALDEQL